MRILFSMRHPGALRNFASTVEELARRQHDVHLSFMMRDKLGDDRLLDEIVSRHQRITTAHRARHNGHRWLGLARQVRYGADYLRYETPAYASASALRERAAQRAPSAIRRLVQRPGFRTEAGRGFIDRCLTIAERAIPPDAQVLDEVQSWSPDVVLATPLVELGSDQVEYIRAARQLGIRSALCVHSWDNLTNKGVIRVRPDRVFVWNDAQKAEAVTMHGVPSGDVVVTGAPVYDQWFGRAPSRTREEFCRVVGLPADRAFFLYLCSSQFIAPEETVFVEEWIRAIRNAPDPAVRDAGILVRPHPRANLRPWQAADFTAYRDVALWPRSGANPVDLDSRNDYFDSMYHAAAAIGINTSAQIEAAIIGRPVYSIRASQYRDTQEGTLHFHLLLADAGGPVHLADTLGEHVRQLAKALTPTSSDVERLRTFVERFVRPAGLNLSATTRLADAVEDVARLGRREPEQTPVWLYGARAVLYPFARGAAAGARRGPTGDRAHASGVADIPARAFTWPPLARYAQRHIVPRVLPRAARGASPRPEGIAIAKLVQRLASSERPIIVGPWLDGVGMELLYWIPFVSWAMGYRAFDPARVIVVSRGGVAPWYRLAGSRWIDVLDLFTPEQLRARNADRVRESKGKHLILTSLDRDVIARVRTDADAPEAEVLHPMQMYRLFAPFWKGSIPVAEVERFTTFNRLPPVAGPTATDARSGEYTAVRFHFNESFPDTGDNRQFIIATVRMLADAGEVVVLSGDAPGNDVRLEPHPHVHVVPVASDSSNLEAQRRVIAGSRAFVGTYGGFSHLAGFQGVPSLSVYSHPAKLSLRHLELGQKVFAQLGSRAYVMDTTDVAHFGLAFVQRPAGVDARAMAGEIRA